MRIIHKLNNKILQGEGDAGLFLTNKKGGYLSLDGKNRYVSAYQGWFNNIAGQLFKSIESVYLEKEPDTVESSDFSAERHSSKSIEKFTLFNGCLAYDVSSYTGSCSIDLDVRKIYDFDDKGRIYSVYKKGRLVVVEYTKFRDDSLTEQGYKVFLIISGIDDFEEPKQWDFRRYSYDSLRGSKSDFYIYKALRFKIAKEAKILFAFSNNLEKGIERLNFVKKNRAFLERALQKYNSKILSKNKTAWNSAIKSLDSLVIPEENKIDASFGIYAGLPWFFQFWARDELISLGAFIKLKRYDFVRNILFKYLDNISPSGRIPNRVPGSELGSADAIGWLVKRLYDFMLVLEKDDMLFKVLPKQDLELIFERVSAAIFSLRANYEKDGLVVNYAKETWIDTDYGGDTREGACIEIQALQLSMYSFMSYLGRILKKKTSEFALLEKQLAKNVRERFLRLPKLADRYYNGVSDFTERPNIFLAYYIYPRLLSRKEWVQVFRKALDSLWLSWGGFSLISQSHRLFSPCYTGENNISYHRGDSWFFLNNLAAVSMHRVDKALFNEHIQKILEASTNEMLFMGFAGHCAEVSHASSLEPAGCFAQAWSAATLIELFDELEKAEPAVQKMRRISLDE